MKKLLFLALCTICLMACSKSAEITVKNLSKYDIQVSVGNRDYPTGGLTIHSNSQESFSTNCSTSPHTTGVYVAYYDLPDVYYVSDMDKYFVYYKKNPTEPTNGYDYIVVVTNDTVDVSLK